MQQEVVESTPTSSNSLRQQAIAGYFQPGAGYFELGAGYFQPGAGYFQPGAGYFGNKKDEQQNKWLVPQPLHAVVNTEQGRGTLRHMVFVNNARKK